MNFRTPLNAILNSYRFIENTFEEMLRIFNKKDRLSSDQQDRLILAESKKMKKFISMGSNSSILLLSLIEDILDLSKMDSGTFKINASKFNLKDLIDEVYDLFYFQCMLKKISFEVDMDRKAKEVIMNSDKGRIKQILLNLISNSFKFTFKGGIKLTWNLVFKDDERFIRFVVLDTGIGIK